MRVVWVFTVPLGFLVLLIGGLPAIFDPDGKPDPDSVLLFNEANYQDKAQDYAELDRRQEALDTCAAIGDKFSDGESEQDICLLHVYNVLGDIDGKIAIYEKWLKEELADGNSGAQTRRLLEGFKEERDKKK